MSFSAGLIWPEALEEDDERYGGPEQPEFNSAGDWAQWLMAVSGGGDPDLEHLGCGALLAIYTDGDEEEVQWTSPKELAKAAQRLAALVRSGDPSVKWIVEQYGDEEADAAERRDGFLAELEIVREMANWAETLPVKRVAFEIG